MRHEWVDTTLEDFKKEAIQPHYPMAKLGLVNRWLWCWTGLYVGHKEIIMETSYLLHCREEDVGPNLTDDLVILTLEQDLDSEENAGFYVGYVLLNTSMIERPSLLFG